MSLPAAVSCWLLWLLSLLGCEQPSSEQYGPRPAVPPTSVLGEKTLEKTVHFPPQDSAVGILQSLELMSGAKILTRDSAWHVNYLQGKKIGYRQTEVCLLETQTKRFVRTDITEEQSLLRDGEKVSFKVRVSQLADEAGNITKFTYRLPIGSELSTISGEVVNGTLKLTECKAESFTTQSLPFPAKTSGFSGLEDSLAVLPMQPGERRTLQMLQLPPLQLIGTVELAAKEIESTQLPAGEVRLLRVEQKIALPGGGSIDCHFWVDSAGTILKYAVPLLQQETYLATREQALDESDAFSVDLVNDMLVRLPKKLTDPHHQQRATYRVRFAGATPEHTAAKLFSAGASQQVRPVDDANALVTVLAIRPDQPAKLASAENGPAPADQQASSLIESDAAEIAQLAVEATGEKPTRNGPATSQENNSKTAWIQAVAIEKFVHEYLTQKNYSQAFSSAAEVARTREGDCTEHSVLVAALCRAQRIPARVAYGLVYVAAEQAFAFHMWSEVWIGDRWVPLDATLALGGIGTGHIKFGHSSLTDMSALLQLLPVMQSVGKLEITVAEDSQPKGSD